MAKLCLMEAAAPFDGKPVRRVAVLVGGDRCLEIARIGKAVGTDGAAVGKGEFGAVILAQIPARRVAKRAVFRHHAPRHDRDMARLDMHPAHLGENLDSAVLRHDQHFGVGIDQHAVGHRCGHHVDAGRHAEMLARIAGACHCPDAINEIDAFARKRRWVPPILTERQVMPVSVRRRLPERNVQSREPARMAHRRADTVEP